SGRTNFKAVEPYKYWRSLLINSQWISQDSGKVTLAELKFLPPSKFKDESYVLTAEMERWRREAKKPANRDELLALASEFIALPLAHVPTKRIKNSATIMIERLLHEPSIEDNHFDTFYLISCKTAPSPTYFILNYQRPDLADNKKNNATLSEADAGAATFEFRAPPKVNNSTNSTVKRSDEYIRKRDEVINQVKAMPGWSFQELNNYIVMTNSKNKRMVKMVEDELDRCQSVFSQFFPYGSNDQSIGRVKIFAERSEYETYVPNGSENSGGLFMSSTQELLIAPLGERNNRAAAKRMMEVLYHEAFHHFAYLNTAGHRMPIWFNEGCARFFENIEFKQSRTVVALEGSKLTYWKQSTPTNANDCKRLLLQIKTMTQKDFYESQPIRNYNFSGMVIYFILKSPAFLPKMQYEKIAERFFEAVKNGDQNPNATAWKDVDIDLFCKNLVEFVESKAWQSRAEKYMPSTTK
ncbi:MAG: hypothetical protein ACRC37_06655, partial [Lentisphaeria bacterium]